MATPESTAGSALPPAPVPHLDAIQLGHQVVSRLRHDSAEHAGNIAGSKGHAQLLRLAALALGLWHHVLVQSHHTILKAGCRQKQGGSGQQSAT